MAKFTPGPTVAAVSGSIGGTVFSRNRYGAYMRFRAKPVVSTTTYVQAAKARLAAATQAYQGLTAAQKSAWASWAQANPVQGSLGFPQVLTGHAAYVGLHCRALLAVETPLDEPPVTTGPEALTTLTMTGDIGAGAFGVVYTPTPLAATEELWIRACVVSSTGINYIENLLKHIQESAAAQASPFDFQTALVARIGTLQVGQVCHAQASVFDAATMLLSPPMRTSVVLTST